MVASPYTVEVHCPQCGAARQIGVYNRKAAIGRWCRPCRDGAKRTHGMKHSRLYHTWEGMKRRCGLIQGADERCREKYRHVVMCAEWATSFERFQQWADSNGYRDNLTIDRIDGRRGYSPDNCRWATVTEQNRNRRNVRLNEQAVAEMRSLRAKGWLHRELACRYGIAPSSVSRILAGKKWS